MEEHPRQTQAPYATSPDTSSVLTFYLQSVTIRFMPYGCRPPPAASPPGARGEASSSRSREPGHKGQGSVLTRRKPRSMPRRPGTSQSRPATRARRGS